MKKILYAIAGLFLAAGLFSCEKVIDVRVNNAAPKYVIEGVVTDGPGIGQVKVSRTKNLDETNSMAGVSGARVKITDENGAVFLLAENSGGIYLGPVQGVPGRRYTLEVTAGGETFTATARMPPLVSPDSLYISTLDFGSVPQLLANVVYRDSAGKGNAYRFVQYVNGKKDRGIYVENDDFTDGRRNIVTLYGDTELEKGDTLSVAMLCIDPVVHDYWSSLSQSATGQSESASPANPVTNLSGGALGYFSAHTVAVKSLVVQ